MLFSFFPIVLAAICWIIWKGFNVTGVHEDPLRCHGRNSGRNLDIEAIKETFNMRVATVIASVCAMAAMFGFLDVALLYFFAHKVNGWNSAKGGIIITIPAVSYACASKLVGMLVRVIGVRACFSCGLVVTMISILMLGPVPFLNAIVR